MNPLDPLPRLLTARLALRELAAADADAVERLAGDPAVAAAALMLPPYGTAAAWIEARRDAHARGEETNFAIARVDDGALVGAIGLAFEAPLAAARLWYWLGRPYRGRGYAAEAVAAVVAYGFEVRELERIWAPRLRADDAAARVFEGIGLAHEGSRRRFVPERGADERVEQHGCLRWEYFARVALCGCAGGDSGPGLAP
jgi:RimJ/RimL family protein N-acetyltransferase